jgi:uncharacterized protein YegP (UPF0339 family)
MKIQFHWWKAKSGKFYFHLTARNGKTIAQSEGYNTKKAMLSTIRLIQTFASVGRVSEIAVKR